MRICIERSAIHAGRFGIGIYDMGNGECVLGNKNETRIDDMERRITNVERNFVRVQLWLATIAGGVLVQLIVMLVSKLS